MIEFEYDGVRVAGTAYRMGDVLDFLEAADGGKLVVVTLEPEPDNPHDQHAVRVVGDGKHIGYLPAVLSDLLAYKGAELIGAELVDADIDVRRRRVSIEIRVRAIA